MTEAQVEFGNVWQRTLAVLDDAGIPAPQRAFLRLTMFVGLIDRTALLAVPDDYTKDVVETRVREQVTTALSDQLGIQVRLAVTVDPSLSRQHDADETQPETATLTELEDADDDVADETSPFSSGPGRGGPVRPRVA